MNTQADLLWQVQLASGEVRAWTLDELDAAFQAGTITEDTFVVAPRSTKWAKLADVAGLDDAAEAAPPTNERAPNSMMPVVSEIASSSSHQLSSDNDFDVDSVSFQSKSRRVVIVGALTAVGAALCGLAFMISHAGAPAETPNVAAATQATPIDEANVGEAKDSLLTDEQKRALVEADRVRAEKHKAAHATSSTRAGKSSGAGVFHAGGNPHDPLNSSL